MKLLRIEMFGGCLCDAFADAGGLRQFALVIELPRKAEGFRNVHALRILRSHSGVLLLLPPFSYAQWFRHRRVAPLRGLLAMQQSGVTPCRDL